MDVVAQPFKMPQPYQTTTTLIPHKVQQPLLVNTTVLVK
jgi:hypothetical protein